jgi:hypothetical protein
VEEINFRINKKDDDLMLLVLWSKIVFFLFCWKKKESLRKEIVLVE